MSDPKITVLIDGSGNCIEIEEGIVAIGSGGLYAQCKYLKSKLKFFFIAAAKALIDIEGMTAEQIAIKSMKIAADLCIYTNHNTTMEILVNEEEQKK